MNEASSFEKLIDQIDAFIRKYYKNEMVKGVLLFVGILIFSFLLTTSLEYFGRFGKVTRAILFFSFVLLNGYLFLTYLLIPLSKLYAFGKRIDRYQASEIIGRFFPNISDRLKNTLQLNAALEVNEGNIELLRASVSQRSNELTLVPFTNAIDMAENRKYLKYVLPLVFAFVLIAVFAPAMITDGTERVVNYNQEFKPKAPFDFILNEKVIQVEEGEDAIVELEVQGKALPDKMYLVSENGKFLMNRKHKNRFEGIIRKPKSSGNFYFETGEFQSEQYKLNVIGKSVIGKSEARLDYPRYLNRTNESVQNAADLVIPEGTKVTWNIVTKNTKNIDFQWNGLIFFKNEFGARMSKSYRNSEALKFTLKNKFSGKLDSVFYRISVIKDAYPSVYVSENVDSINSGVRRFKGQAEDDYGVKSVYFVYNVISETGKKREQRMLVENGIGSQMDFNFGVDFRRENLALKDKIEYYFVVYDNDGVNGSKSSRSQVYTYQLPGLFDLNDQRNSERDQVKESLQDVIKKTDDFQKKIDKLQKDALNNKGNDWNKLNQVQQLKEEQQNLINKLENIQNQMQQSMENKNQLSEMDKELLEKQEMIEKLLEQLMDDELKKLLDELQKLMEQNDKLGTQDKLEKLENNTEEMKRQLDRSLEMLKRLEVNEKIDDLEKELKELAKIQEELKKDIESKKLNEESALKKQEDINKKFEDLKDELKDLKEKNEALEKPMQLEDTKKAEDKISNDLKDAKQNMQESKQKKAGEKQKSAADEMNKMAEMMDQMQQKANQKQQEEDVDALRRVLESLMTLSFDQEEVMNKMARVQTNDPNYKRYGRRQRRIIDDTQLVKDSLLALAKRQPKIASFIDKELRAIDESHSGAIEAIDDHRKKDISKFQQLAMTSYNNLALLLNESLQSMQSQMQSQSQGSGSCSNPGKGRPKAGQSMNPGDMKEMLKKQLEQMQKGPNPGGQKPGDKPGDKPGQQGSGQGMMGLGNKEIAKMAAEQTAIRQRLEQMRNELNKEGQGLGNKLNPLIKELEEQEKQLINKQINRETINRQKEILTRLLESENAIMERGFEEKRESKSGKDDFNGNQIKLEEYKKDKARQVELLRFVDPSLRKYYKDKANAYFNQN